MDVPVRGPSEGQTLPRRPGRTVYLAKPATDMRAAYFRMVEELRRRDFSVVPDPTEEIPYHTSAMTVVDEALSEAEVSIHLLGQLPGYAPELSEPIVKLQLTRAAARVPAASENASTTAEPVFRRIIWAPKIMEDPAASKPPPERDPFAVLASFAERTATDKIEGDTESKFVDFVIQHLTRTEPMRKLPAGIKADARIYLFHSREDTDFVFNLAQALQEHQVELLYPAFDGTPDEIANYHNQNLMNCDAVVICWYSASEVWVRAQSDGWKNWHGLGRTECFAYRGLVAGPPPGDRKKFFVRLKRGEFDLVVDLTDVDPPPPDKLDRLVRIERPANP